ncbi:MULTISPECIES: LCP family protein [unclassified Bifidobacterium]|uniref:LCP family protein n=1 Tax=unclassified Bifidobacterium TaxID=2608897 RepID=UPI0023FA0D83|nr:MULTISPECIES: LCP family protein [unclassified Bifidobacterium]WEV65204.1 LCP family protein [Bifidobacterium sp. ESL0764]WEV75983.1 LCP family protein [Bifidobacterium sp. ESL0800]
MVKQSGGFDAQGTPPSFIPSGARKRPDTGRVPVPSATPQVPPAFSPAKPRKRTASHRPIQKPDQPPALAPAQPRTPRQSTGSSRIASPARSSSSRSSKREYNGSAISPKRPSRAQPSGFGSGFGNEATRPHKKHHWVLSALLAIVLVIVLAIFGCWNWANSQLDKSDWLTGKVNTNGTSWLVLGSDERDDSGVGGSADDTPGFRTDTILVLTKPSHGSSSLISIPRDSLVKVDGTNMKINAVAETQSKKTLTGKVEDITGQKIDHVAEIKFNGLTHVVDALGGVKLCYDNTVNDAYSGLNWQAGCHVADGGTALAFSRMRYSDPKGDFGRAERQRQVIGAIMSKASSSDIMKSPTKAQKVAKAALSSIEVDKQTNPLTLLSMAKAFKAATGKSGISGSVYWTDPDYYVDGVGSSVLLDDSKNLELFSQLASGDHKPGTVGTLAESVGQN